MVGIALPPIRFQYGFIMEYIRFFHEHKEKYRNRIFPSLEGRGRVRNVIIVGFARNDGEGGWLTPKVSAFLLFLSVL